MRFFKPTASAPPAQSVGMGFPTAPSPALTAPTEDRGKTPCGFSRNRVWSTLNASENPSLKYTLNKHGNTQLWNVRIRSKQPVSKTGAIT